MLGSRVAQGLTRSDPPLPKVFFRFVDEGYDGQPALQGYASPQPAVTRLL